jgi:hypothetical protein
VLSTFFSDVGHEAVTAILPLYLGSIGLGAAALGMMEAPRGPLVQLVEAGGRLGRAAQREEARLGTLGYLATAVATGAMPSSRASPGS